MGITKAIARDIPVNGVNFVEYFYRTTTEGVEVPTTVHHVAVKVNKNVFVGEYSANSEANAFSLAQDVVKGLLIKNGCTRPDSRITGIKFKKYNFPVPSPIGDAIPNPTPNWNNITFQEDGSCPMGCNTNSGQQITGIDVPITLYLSWTGFPTASDRPWVKVTNTYNANDATVFPQTASGFTQVDSGTGFVVTNNQWVWFSTLTYDETTRTITVVNSSNNNTVLDTFTQSFVNMCLLTTVVVNYLGLQDNGPELTAMRALRTHFKPVAAAELADYYQNSPNIINAITTAGTQATEYNYIYNTVLAIVNHVNNEQWQSAYDLYMAMYTDLKTRYLGA